MKTLTQTLADGLATANHLHMREIIAREIGDTAIADALRAGIDSIMELRRELAAHTDWELEPLEVSDAMGLGDYPESRHPRTDEQAADSMFGRGLR